MSSLPTTLGKYQIIREIARSNDIVYEAFDPVMNRRVALKELAVIGGSTSVQKEDRLKRFLREAKAAGSLAHPNIVTIYEVGVEADRHYLAMEYLEGHTLRNELDLNGFLPPDRAVGVTVAVLEALDYAHQHGVIHRDIKPGNIQLVADGRVKLMDFGIARLTFEPNITMDGQVFGTPSYMSPEQVVGKEIDLRSDLFSVGIVLYEMLTGQQPFKGDSVVSITYAIMNKEPEEATTISWPLRQVMERALDKSPGQRYSSAKEMQAALEGACAASQQQVFDPSPPQHPPAYPYPYLVAQGMAPPPPQITYPYNPYQPPAGSAPPLLPGVIPQLHPGGQIGGNPIPIYYPRPPRQPLLSPESKLFLRKLLVSIAVLGSLFGLVIVGLSAMTTAYSRLKDDEHDRGIRNEALQQDSNLPIADRIAIFEKYIAKLQNPSNIAEEKRNLAVLYEQQGKAKLVQSDTVGAEQSFLKSMELDPQHAAYASDLGSLYSQASDGANSETRPEYLAESVRMWKKAVELERDPDVSARYKVAAATTIYNYAAQIAEMDPRTARENLYDAQAWAEPGSELYNRIRDLLDTISRRG